MAKSFLRACQPRFEGFSDDGLGVEAGDQMEGGFIGQVAGDAPEVGVVGQHGAELLELVRVGVVLVDLVGEGEEVLEDDGVEFVKI